MKICLVCSEYPPSPFGGKGIVTRTLARGLVARGHAVRVIGLCELGDGSPDRQVDEGVSVLRLRRPHVPYGWLIGRWRLFALVRRWASAGEVDMVEVPLSRGWAAAWGRLPVPVVVRLHGSRTVQAEAVGRRPDRVAYWIERLTLRRADRCCAVSRAIADQVFRAYRRSPDDVTVLHNPVDVPSPPPAWSLRRRFSVVLAGTLKEVKGIGTLVQAWKGVRAAIGSAELHLYGQDGTCRDGRPMSDWVRQALGELEPRGVFLHGHVRREDVLEAFRTSRLAVFPSYEEAFGLAAAEAMACGCPTVFTQCASGPELIEHGRDGWLIDPRKPDDLSEAIVALLSDEDRARRLGENGSARVRAQFASERIIPLNEAFFAECVQRFQSVTRR